MVSFFQGLGDVAGGFSQTYNPWLQNAPQMQALDAQGAAIRAAAGLPPAQQSQGGLGSLFSGLGGLLGGQQPGVGASPASGPSPMSSSQPMVGPGIGTGGGAQPGGQGQGITNLFQPPASPQGPQQGQQGTAAMPPPQSYSTPAGGPQGGQQFGIGGMGMNPIDMVRSMYQANPRVTNRDIALGLGGGGMGRGYGQITPYQAGELNLHNREQDPGVFGTPAWYRATETKDRETREKREQGIADRKSQDDARVSAEKRVADARLAVNDLFNHRDKLIGDLTQMFNANPGGDFSDEAKANIKALKDEIDDINKNQIPAAKTQLTDVEKEYRSGAWKGDSGEGGKSGDTGGEKAQTITDPKAADSLPKGTRFIYNGQLYIAQ